MNEDAGGLSGRIVGAAICVHEELGPGFLEGVYEEALCAELTARGMRFQRQRPGAVGFRDRLLGESRLDMVDPGRIVVEFKAISGFESIHFATVRSYLKATNCSLGLRLNFASATLQIKRVGREWHSNAE